MRQEIIVSDLTGKPIPEGEAASVTITIDGKAHRIDLTSAEAAKLAETYKLTDENAVGAVSRTPARRGASKPRSANSDNAAIRAWWNDEGHKSYGANGGKPLGDRGRIPDEIRDAYKLTQSA